MNINDLAEKGLEKLKGGEVGINIDALNKEDAKYVQNYFQSKGYSAQVGTPEGTMHPVNIINQIPEGGQNA